MYGNVNSYTKLKKVRKWCLIAQSATKQANLFLLIKISMQLKLQTLW